MNANPFANVVDANALLDGIDERLNGLVAAWAAPACDGSDQPCWRRAMPVVSGHGNLLRSFEPSMIHRTASREQQREQRQQWKSQ